MISKHKNWDIWKGRIDFETISCFLCLFCKMSYKYWQSGSVKWYILQLYIILYLSWNYPQFNRHYRHNRIMYIYTGNSIILDPSLIYYQQGKQYFVKNTGPCITNVFATRRKNFSQWYRSFQRKLLSHWLKILRHVAITLVIQGPGFYAETAVW